MTVLDAIVLLFRAITNFLTNAFATAQTRMEQIIRNREFTWDKDAADAMLADATAERPVWQVPDSAVNGVEVVSVRYVPNAALTASDVNFATILVDKRSAAGGAGVNLATESTETVPTGGSGSWTAFVAVPIPVSAVLATRSLAVNESLTVEITKAGAGVAVPAGTLHIVYREL